MKTVLNSVVAWLRSKPAIDETKLKAVVVNADSAAVHLAFSTEEELAAFGQAHLSEATVVKLAQAEQLVFRATVTWRKRTITVFLKVSAEVPRPASEAFSVVGR